MYDHINKFLDFLRSGRLWKTGAGWRFLCRRRGLDVDGVWLAQQQQPRHLAEGSRPPSFWPQMHLLFSRTPCSFLEHNWDWFDWDCISKKMGGEKMSRPVASETHCHWCWESYLLIRISVRLNVLEIISHLISVNRDFKHWPFHIMLFDETGKRRLILNSACQSFSVAFKGKLNWIESSLVWMWH